MSEKIHDDEPDTSERVVRELLTSECPQWRDQPVEYLATSGTDNAMWRIRFENRTDLVVRLPRRPGAAANVPMELAVLDRLQHVLPSTINTPRVRHIGEPHVVFPHCWSILEWISGTDLWTARDAVDRSSQHALAVELAELFRTLGPLAEMPCSQRSAGRRGGPLLPLLERIDHWIHDPQWDAANRIDVQAVKRVAHAGREVANEPIPHGFVHGDLIPGNLLIDVARNISGETDRHLAAVIDWGGAGYGDVAQDLAPAWSVLTARGRDVFRDACGVDDATWIRGRTIELEHAIGGVLYYVPRKHQLGDVMSRTLTRILQNE